MKNTYFDRKKKLMFPFIKDWSEPQDHLRLKKDWGNMPYMEWFWFHPISYHINCYSLYGCSILSFGFLTYYFWNRFIPIALLGLFIVCWQMWKLLERFKNHKVFKTYNMYDMFLRETPGGQDG